MNFKIIRVTILLLVLGYVGLDSLLTNTRTNSWENSIRVVIYPINADGSTKTKQYIDQIEVSQFEGIAALIKKEAERYGVNLLKPMMINLAKPIDTLPPAIPEGKNILSVAWWSLQLRYWSWKEDHYEGTRPHIRAYALYFDPQTHFQLAHSTGLEKGKIAVIQLFADRRHTLQNNVIVLHELLHTIGATDKYDPQTNLPVYPDGYAHPDRKPLHPQKRAEIMGGRIAISEIKAKIPSNLSQTLIGPKTAQEIGWVE